MNIFARLFNKLFPKREPEEEYMYLAFNKHHISKSSDGINWEKYTASWCTEEPGGDADPEWTNVIVIKAPKQVQSTVQDVRDDKDDKKGLVK